MSSPPSPPRALAPEGILTSSTTTSGAPAPRLALSLDTNPAPVPAGSVPATGSGSDTSPAHGTSLSASSDLRLTGLSVATTLSLPGAPATAAESPVRSGRRSKTHVASACINCKRAHLSCDVQRPCARCVASGKQDTCIDVQHKKRGRPRLREEGELRVQQPGPVRTAEPVIAGPATSAARPTAETRHRRGESFRSLRSQASDESTGYAATTPRQFLSTALPPPFAAQPLAPTPARPAFEIATALLNTDMVIIRANIQFEQILFGGQPVRGRHISDIATPADAESFLTIRNRLRAERESREPTFMPPILRPGQDPLVGIPETDADRYTQGLSDRTYIWTYAQPAGRFETFPVRVRQAKASTYFVVVTLPSFRPVEPRTSPMYPMHAPPLLFGPPLQTHSALPPRQSGSLSAPPFTPLPFASPTAMTQPQGDPIQALSSRTYPPPQPFLPYQAQQQPQPMFYSTAPLTPRLPVAEPPTEPTAFTPRSLPIESLRVMEAPPLNLPPIGARPVTAGPSASQEMKGLSEEEDGGPNLRSPRKRRRVGIRDVLQR
ncbi:hypothetical protein BAUCODRAFT_152155 [Baudoinia panamericana UAMH 10762]|uniref:Zn(2)-C6 fungal-type domain-containing protein n=1 Tax=Baudoinia panamericana (strain UAMH 10762) TaxID=717646 RepID=M2M575_BAUPA|nr:uncharacterized protein BAUCODRAFT_152155 [Baudoinia panamericana UAMH 10762]EMC91776.1 hypothetical protein BAUCODRAFT_152155 [Baudoinia panamericana UAMH 10762]